MPFVTGPLPQRLKLVHGFGAVAFGVKDNGFSFFLLIFYNQVLGMDAGLVGLALALALLVDAVADPFIGYFSDRTYTKWGRRLPWLYIAPWPLAIMWVILWSPPTGEAPSFLGLLGIAVGVRVLLSACEVPQVSLLPEITADYDERTTLFRYRYLMGWSGGIVMMILLVGLASIIQDRAAETDATTVPAAAPTTEPTQAPPQNDPLVEAGVVPDLPAQPTATPSATPTAGPIGEGDALLAPN